MNIITGYMGEAHITAQEDRDINLGIVGKSTTELYVLDVGQQLEAEIVSANEVRVKDGLLIMQGCAASIDYGSYDALTISNGSQGMQRIDVIAAEYEKDGDTNVESVTLVVVEGTPAASDPSVPSLTSGSIQAGDSLVQMPLYYVTIDGVSISSVDAQFTVSKNLAALTSPTESFSGTMASNISGRCGGIYDKLTGTVRINFCASKSSDIGTSDTLITIPAAYRPSSTVYGSGVIETYISNEYRSRAYQVSLNSSGQIKQGYSSYARSAFGVFEYTL